MALNLADLGLDPDDHSPATPTTPAAPAHAGLPSGLDPGTTTLRDAVLGDADGRFQKVLADLGVTKATECLAKAVKQIWGQRPDLMPAAATLFTAAVEGRTDVERLDDLLRLVFPVRTANRVLVLTGRHADAFIDLRPGWSGRLADDGVDPVEIERRAALGEFDATGPLPSRFDLTTMDWPEEDGDLP